MKECFNCYYQQYTFKDTPMNIEYHLIFCLKIPYGLQNLATFNLGHHKGRAAAIFQRLKSSDAESARSILQMEFAEIKDGIPFPIEILHCTIDDIASNARVITRDLYKEWC